MSVSEVKRPDEDSLLQRVRQYFRETRAELRKVIWPTRDQTTNLTTIVLVVLVLMSLLLGGIDAVIAAVFQYILR